MSVGQKATACMAKALLESNKILIIDGATSNVDRILVLRIVAIIVNINLTCMLINLY